MKIILVLCNRISCNLEWPGTQQVTKDDLEPLILLCPPPKCIIHQAKMGNYYRDRQWDWPTHLWGLRSSRTCQLQAGDPANLMMLISGLKPRNKQCICLSKSEVQDQDRWAKDEWKVSLHLSLPFISLTFIYSHIRSTIGDTHLLWGRPAALFSQLTQTITSPKYTFTAMPKIMFNQLS